MEVRPRVPWLLCLVGIIAAGILSRVVHTGFAVFDKYLGDALYAAMVYAILRLFWRAVVSEKWQKSLRWLLLPFQVSSNAPGHLDRLLVPLIGPTTENVCYALSFNNSFANFTPIRCVRP